jgi:FkbH-like protein
LKERGILLAICSKNDPSNVHWEGALLGPDDFVTAEINWAPKSSNIRQIADVLNLNPSSFVFLDDRPDERAMVTSAMPGVLALDPNTRETWELLNRWADMGKAAALQDRTGLYQERAKRQAYLDSRAPEAEDIGKAYAELGLKVSLRHPVRGEMQRVVELINRTNQFNTTGARTTLALMTADSASRKVLLADVQDKFGTMGIVGAMIVELGPMPLITHFVLSCRVFGFAIEDAMLNAVRRGLGEAVVRAHLVETPVNGPCRDVYSRNGFEKSGDEWIAGGSVIGTDAPWLSIHDETCWADAMRVD